jgi:hypothetical protein
MIYPTVARVRELLDYDAITGVFTWRPDRQGVRRNRRGVVAGGVDSYGYVRIKVDGSRIGAHRLAWMHVHGAPPADQIDHIDGNRTNNAIANLRDVPAVVNRQNIRLPKAGNKTGLLGVCAPKYEGCRYLAMICHNGKKIRLGYFDTPEQAHSAYIAAKREYHAGCTL